jgi:hypothetical protein
MRPRVLLIDLHELPKPREVLNEVRFVLPAERVLVITALGSRPRRTPIQPKQLKRIHEEWNAKKTNVGNHGPWRQGPVRCWRYGPNEIRLRLQCRSAEL